MCNHSIISSLIFSFIPSLTALTCSLIALSHPTFASQTEPCKQFGPAFHHLTTYRHASLEDPVCISPIEKPSSLKSPRLISLAQRSSQSRLQNEFGIDRTRISINTADHKIVGLVKDIEDRARILFIRSSVLVAPETHGPSTTKMSRFVCWSMQSAYINKGGWKIWENVRDEFDLSPSIKPHPKKTYWGYCEFEASTPAE